MYGSAKAKRPTGIGVKHIINPSDDFLFALTQAFDGAMFDDDFEEKVLNYVMTNNNSTYNVQHSPHRLG